MAGGNLFVEVGVTLVEGRVGSAPHGPHVALHQHNPHKCQDNAFLCERASKLKRHMGLLSDNRVPMCIDVFLCPDCPCGAGRASATNICSGPSPHDLLLEQWTVSLVPNKSGGAAIEGKALLQAIRSQLHFSQLGAWAALGRVPPVCYRLSHPGTHSPAPAFARPPASHIFPSAKTSRTDVYLKVSVETLPRMDSVPVLECPLHSAPSSLSATVTVFKSVFAELGHCLLDPPSKLPPPLKHGGGCWREKRTPSPPAKPSRSHRLCRPTITLPTRLVDDRLQSGCQHIGKHHCQDDEPPTNNSGDSGKGCESSGSCSSSVMKSLISVGGFTPPAVANSVINVFRSEVIEGKGKVNPLKRKRQESNTHCKKLLSEQTADLTESFNLLKLTDSFYHLPCPIRKNQLILPTTPPPSRRGSRQVTDSSSEDTECESPVSSNYSPLRLVHPQHKYHRSHLKPLLGNFEESILCGRVKAIRQVDGYTADLGASGAFCPRHLKLPVTVSFFPVQGYSAPYMGVVKLNKKGYHIPRSGTVQVTLLNPLGTVIKMFVVPYDVGDIPPSSQTFIRQRILANTALRYLIHLRFSSSKSGRVFLHTDLKMIIARQYDMDASMELDIESNCQLKSVLLAPSHPKYSTKK